MFRMKIITITALLVCLTLHAFAAPEWLAKSLVQQQVLPDSVTDKGDFGSSVAVSDRFAVVGAADNALGGSIYIYEKNANSWILKQQFTAEYENIKMGISVALNDQYVFTGASQYKLDNGQDAGIVYVYHLKSDGQWEKSQELMPNQVENADRFGVSLAVHENQLIVGSYGKAYIFELENNQWTQKHSLEAEESENCFRFGSAVDIFDNYAIIGDKFGFNFTGAAYIFQKNENQWKQVQLLRPIYDGKSNFSCDVAISDQYAIVGASGEGSPEADKDAGAVYIYKQNSNNWEFISKQVEDNLYKYDKYGISVELLDNILAVGAQKKDSDQLSDAGTVFIYEIENNNLIKHHSVVPIEPYPQALFGCDISFCHTTILVGAELFKKDGIQKGTAYFFDAKNQLEVTNPISDQTTDKDALYIYTFPIDTFNNGDITDPLTYFATQSDDSELPAWLTFDATTRTFSGTPLNDDTGTIQIKVTATSTHQPISASDIFALTIVKVNNAPTVENSLPDQSTGEDLSYSFTFNINTFVDVDNGDTLTYTATLDNNTPLPAWLNFDPINRKFSGIPLNDDVGTIQIKVTATDQELASVSDTFTLTVNNYEGLFGADGVLGLDDVIHWLKDISQ